MKTGKLRHLVSVEAPAHSQDTYGQSRQSWSLHAEVFASIEPLTGDKRWRAQQVQPDVTHTIRMHYLQGIDTNMRVSYRGRTFNILAVLDDAERGVELELMCVERADGIRDQR